MLGLNIGPVDFIIYYIDFEFFARFKWDILYNEIQKETVFIKKHLLV